MFKTLCLSGRWRWNLNVILSVTKFLFKIKKELVTLNWGHYLLILRNSGCHERYWEMS